ISVVREDPGLTLFMGGYRVALTLDEARSLLGALDAALAGAPGDRAAIVARVTEQLISWSEIAEAAKRR
ncbi:MAG TPA: hypothetical protein VE397_14420, partial [Stellaceae bacterium]|nr:hypothetical protein [Stellaceae bacterium]